MTYKLKFIPSAWKEWRKLDNSLKTQFKNKLNERLENPHVPSALLSGTHAAYKIKLRAAGYRLVYEVEEQEVTVTVIAIGRRDGNVYIVAEARLDS